MTRYWLIVRGLWRPPLNRQLAKAAMLALVCIVLLVELGIQWSGASGQAVQAVSSKEAQLRSLTRATAPLQGADKRMVALRTHIERFYAERFPSRYSQIATRIRELEIQSGAHLSQVVFTQRAKGVKLTELSISSGISGSYPQIMRFINGLERDQTFFLVRAMTLTGDQGGEVNLRLRLSTWLRNSVADPGSLPVSVQVESAPKTKPHAEKE